ncbi:MAG TPA: TolC family protein, partial [Candidatus Polarisedimenticolaceae bacterium]|nr:TolC family protein [Candidatus Polarisedimenticolaceae bacterium]
FAARSPSTLGQQSPDLASFLRLLEERHPRLQADAARIRASEARIAPTQALPDPQVRLSYTNDGVQDITFGDSMDANLTLSYEQEVPRRGKRRLSGTVASAEVDVARSELDLDRRALREQVILAYLDVLRADRTHGIVEASREVLRTLLASARARYEAGQGVLEDLLKTQTEITRIEVEVATLDQERAEAAARLNAAVGRPPGTPIPALTHVPTLAMPDGQEAMAATASSPVLERMRRMEAVSAARLESAKLAAKPDWMWGASWAERGSLDPMVMGMVGARLPLWRKSKQLQEAAAAEGDLAAARAAREAEGLSTSGEVAELLARAQGAQRRLDLLEQALIPQARSTLEAGSASYANGRSVFISLLDDAIDLLQFERDRERQRAELGAALAGIEARTSLQLVDGGIEP